MSALTSYLLTFLIATLNLVDLLFLDDNWTGKIGFQIAFLPFALCFLQFICERLFWSNKEFMWVTRRFYILSLALRTVMLFCICGLYAYNKVSLNGVWDDLLYHELARSHGNAVIESGNFYFGLLSFAYGLFGDTTLVGRMINIALSSLCIYPVALIFCHLNIKKAYIKMALLIFSIIPSMAAWSIFEIKDIIIQFALLASIGIYITQVNNKSISICAVFALLLMGYVLEKSRSGAGLILLISLILQLLKDLKIKGHLTNISRVSLSLSAILIIVLLNHTGVLGAPIESVPTKLQQYRTWNYRQIQEGVFRDRLIVSNVGQIWKLPVSFIAYLISPIPRIDLSPQLPFMIEFGGIIKAFEFPLLIAGLLLIFNIVKRLGYLVLPFIFPLLFLVLYNPTNWRQGVAYMPIFYISGIAFFIKILKCSPKTGQGNKVEDGLP